MFISYIYYISILTILFFIVNTSEKNTQTFQSQENEEYEKSRLADRIVNLISRIKRINSFDSNIRNLSNVSSYELKRKSLDELQRLNSSLENRLLELDRENQRSNQSRESLEASKWTGEKPKHMNNFDFDRFQRSDDYR